MAAAAINTLIRSIKPSYELRGKELFAARVGCAMVSSMPAYRTIGALAYRALVLVQRASVAHDSYDSLDPRSHFYTQDVKWARCDGAKTAAAALALIGLIRGNPMLVAASFAADLSIRFFEMYSSWKEKHLRTDYESLFYRLAPMVINAAMLGAVVTGSWPMMVVAASVSAINNARIVYNLHSNSNPHGPDAKNDYLKSLCFAVLAGVGLKVAINPPFPAAQFFTAPFGVS